jgi:hypothetical protein
MFSGAFLLASLSAWTSAGNAVVLDPESRLAGLSRAELSAEWWKWAMSSADPVNPVKDRTGAHCAVGQQGGVWFLAGGFGSSKIKRRCTIPAGRHLFFPAVNMVYWPDRGGNGFTCARAQRYAAVNNDEALDLFVELDGVPVEDVKRYRARTEKCFDLYERLPASVKPYKAYPSASDGYWILLAPLSKGRHTLRFGGRYSNAASAYGRMLQDIEYELIVE